MTTVPPPNVAPLPVAAPAAAPTTIVIAQPPPALAAVPAGTIIEAVVLPAPAPSAPAAPSAPPALAPPPIVLHTAVGDIPVRLPAPLPNRTSVELEVVRASPQQVTVRLATIEGSPAHQYLTQSRAPAAPLTTPPPPPALAQGKPLPGPQPLPQGYGWMPSGPTPFVQLGLISAVIVQAPAPAATLAAAAPSPPSAGAPSGTAAAVPAMPTLAALPVGTGSELGLKIVSVQMPGAALVAAPMPSGAGPAVPASPAPNPAPTASPSSGQVAGPITAPLVQAPTAPPAAPPGPSTVTSAPPPGLVIAGPKGLPPAPPQPPTLTQAAPPLATVTGVVVANADAIPVVEIEGRQVQLNIRAHLPVGTKIVFDVTAVTAARTGAPLPLPLPAAAAPLSGPAGAAIGWPTLAESLSVLQRVDPSAAQQLSQAIPDGGPRTAVAVISFVQALRSGDARQWPGDSSLRALERTGPRGAQLAATLSGEVAELSSRAREASGEWRALPIPWNAEGHIERVALITRREGESESEDGPGKTGGGQRFLIELNLSRLGPMQLDGMFKKAARSFDMVLRTKAALPEEMRKDLMGLFAAANAAMGLTGGLVFQVTRKFADPLGLGNSPDKSGLWA